jgi:alpha-glucosidase
MVKKSVLAVCLLVVVPLPAAAGHLYVNSPNGDLTVSVEVKSNPQPYLPGDRLYYQIAYQGAAILRDSPMGLDFIGAPPLDHDFQVTGSSHDSHNATWEDDFGARRGVPDHYNQLTVSLEEKGALHRRMDVIFRAYNEGIAFRYSLPRQAGLEKFTLTAENTGFYFARPATAFASTSSRFNNAYETQYFPLDVNLIKPNATAVLPLLAHLSGGPWLAILEADLRDYAGMYLGGVLGVPDSLTSRLAPLPDAFYENVFKSINFTNAEAVRGVTPASTPWRVILVGRTPGSLIEHDYLVQDLNPPNVLPDVSWIRPGKAAWSWWSGDYATGVDFKLGMNTATMNHYTDFAAEHHLEYLLIDAGWNVEGDITRPIPAIDLPGIIAHASARGVRVMLWVHWEALKKQMDEALALYEKWGIAGVKIDFMNRDDQEMVNFYEEMARKTAAHHLVVDWHGAYKPTGLARTYPNVLNYEGVQGMEYSKGSYLTTPEHDVTIPFTRMLAGPMDYTPGCFINATKAQFKPRNVQPMCQGTRAHQLAMYVVFLSPLEMLSDYPESYDHNPGMEFLDKVPTVWDETRALNGEPGKYITLARRHEDTWYVGAMSNWDGRDLDIPLSFLGPGTYAAEIFADGPDADTVATSLQTSKKSVTAGETLHVHLASGGGWAAILAPVK